MPFITGLNSGARTLVGLTLVALGLWCTPSPAAAQAVATEQVGTVNDVSGSCPELVFVLDSILTVSTDTDTDFHGLSCDDIRVGLRVEIDGFQQTNGRVAALEVELNYEGPVVGLSGSCPVAMPPTVLMKFRRSASMSPPSTSVPFAATRPEPTAAASAVARHGPIRGPRRGVGHVISRSLVGSGRATGGGERRPRIVLD